MPAPSMPYGGIRSRFSATFTTAAAPVITQLERVLRARLIPITTTMYAPNATVANESGPTTRDAGQKSGFEAASTRTIHGESSVRARANHDVTRTMYVRTNAYVRRASLSSEIEYANAGHAARNAASITSI